MAMIGININDTTQDFTGQILALEKTVETRTHRRLDAFIGQRVALVKTMKGKKPLVVGYATLGEPCTYKDEDEFYGDFNRHQISKDNETFKWNGKKRYGYPLYNVEQCDPFIPQVTKERYSHKEMVGENKIHNNVVKAMEDYLNGKISSKKANGAIKKLENMINEDIIDMVVNQIIKENR